MEQNSTDNTGPVEKRARSRFLEVVGIAAIFIVIIALLAGVWVKYNIYASEFRPTELSKKEQKVLDSKLALLNDSAKRDRSIRREERYTDKDRLAPEPYTEEGASRQIDLTEREFNALIANTPEIARRVAVDLSENLVSLKLVVPLDEDIPVLGGKTLRLNLGVHLSYEDDQPVVALKGLSLGGVPLPNAWLGYLKNENLVKEFGSGGGFWELFAEGIDDIKVEDGHIMIHLKE
jgi:hypothetical protein